MQRGVKSLACRAIWRVNAEDIALAKNLISTKRLDLDDTLSKVFGIQFFFSCATMMMTNPSCRNSSGKNEARRARPTYPGVAYFIAYRPNDVCDENKIFALLHDADMQPTITKIRTATAAAALFQVLKDHCNAAVQKLVTLSNEYCLMRALSELDDQQTISAPTRPRNYPTKPCRIVVVNESECLENMMDAHGKLQSDGLVADIVSIPNPFADSLPTSPSDVTVTVKDIDTVMERCGHALYRGNVFTRPNQSRMTFVHMMDIGSYLHHLLSNDILRERVLKHFSILTRILGHGECTIVRQLEFDNDLIEVLGGVVFQISTRRFIPCPLQPDALRKISPRSFVPYDSTITPDASYFRLGIFNSFPELGGRIRFLNKFYQCLVPGKMPQKVRKLVAAGPKDSGKTSWAAIFHKLIPPNCIATITKERQFSAAMIDDSTQLVIIDDWSASTMESDLAKTLLQGGWMTTAVKHQQPRCFFNSSPFYITTNEVPDFGNENENVQRRLAIFNTLSLEQTVVGADKWIFDNAMHCVAWMASQINENLDCVEVQERWYENNQQVCISNTPSRESCTLIAHVSSADMTRRNSQETACRSTSTRTIHSSFAREAVRLTRNIKRQRNALMQESSSSSEDDWDETLNERLCVFRSSTSREDQHLVSNRQEDEDQEESENDDDDEDYHFQSPTQWTLNSKMYFRRVAGIIQTKFYGEKLNDRRTLSFVARVENSSRKEKDFWTKADPTIDAWMLIRGQVRDSFDLRAFVQAYPAMDVHLSELRKLVKRRVLHDDCPVVRMKRQITEELTSENVAGKQNNLPASRSDQQSQEQTTQGQRLNIKRKRKMKSHPTQMKMLSLKE